MTTRPITLLKLHLLLNSYSFVPVTTWHWSSAFFTLRFEFRLLMSFIQSFPHTWRCLFCASWDDFKQLIGLFHVWSSRVYSIRCIAFVVSCSMVCCCLWFCCLSVDFVVPLCLFDTFSYPTDIDSSWFRGTSVTCKHKIHTFYTDRWDTFVVVGWMLIGTNNNFNGSQQIDTVCSCYSVLDICCTTSVLFVNTNQYTKRLESGSITARISFVIRRFSSVGFVLYNYYTLTAIGLVYNYSVPIRVTLYTNDGISERER